MLDPIAKKTVLRQFTYGLYAVTSAHAGVSNVFTANWLTQVSFDPPMIAVSVENDSTSLSLIRASARFGVNVFATGQRELAGSLGKPRARVGDKLAALAHLYSEAGLPILSDALGYAECLIAGELPAGDSTLLLGEVVDARVLREGDPLTMREAGFRHFG
jgi:flavin reductase (DIM6/NTAB) family NADH-FMN oxidoreductase RutF